MSKFSEAARILGSIKSKRKAIASRKNGKKGGRPKKETQSRSNKIKKEVPVEV